MADQSKLEQMLEKLVNNDRDGAESLFHEFVIEKSRGIYEKMLEDDLKDLEVDEGSHDKDKKDEKKKKDDKDMKEESDESEESVEEASKEDEEVDEASKEDEEVDEASDEETDENMEITPEADPMGGDAADDMIDDMEADDDGEEDKGDDEEIEDRVVDLEDALDDLKAEFEKMMSDKGEGDDDAEDKGEEEAIVSQDAEGEVEVAPELAPEEVIPAVEAKDNTPKTATEEIREYVNKVDAKHSDGTDNSHSPVAKSGGADAKADGKNLVQGGEEKGGKAPMPKEDNAGNVNTPGSKAGSKQSAAKANTADGTDGSAKKSAIGS